MPNKNEIIEKFFPEGKKYYDITSTTTEIPLIKATLIKETDSFSLNQTLYIVDGYLGMYERFQVIGRYRKKHRWILGECPMSSLTNHRIKIVYHPQIIKKLAGHHIRRLILEIEFDDNH